MLKITLHLVLIHNLNQLKTVVLSLSTNGFRPTSLFVIEAMFAVFLFPMRLCEVSAAFVSFGGAAANVYVPLFSQHP